MGAPGREDAPSLRRYIVDRRIGPSSAEVEHHFLLYLFDCPKAVVDKS